MTSDTVEVSAEPRHLSVIQALAEAAVGLRFDQLPPDVTTLAGICVLDTLGVALAGRTQPVVQLIREELAEPGDAVLWGGARSDPGSAALVNGVAAHALDYDDYAPGSGLHPSAPLVAALLSAASLQHGRGRTVTGRDLVAAYVAGYEVQERLGLVLWPSHYARGFHTTGTAGTVGAAAGVAHLLGTGPREMAAALGVGATDAAGLKAMFGSMGKPYHAGRAAASGLRAARLAMRGMTVGDDPLFGPQGLVAASSAATPADLGPVRAPFGEPWHILDVLPKLTPACFGTHAAIACALDVRAAVGEQPIRRVVLTIPPVLLDVCAIPTPRTGLEGKFSLAYTTAAALLHGTVSVASFTDEAVRAEPVVELGSRVELVLDERLVKTATRLRVELGDGRVLTADRDAAQRLWSGSPEEVRTRVEGKFLELAEGVAAPVDIVALLRDLPALADVEALSALLAGAD
ncbi:MAG TPA: MmgE/PrpD family protein [Pseudonocardia sp.]|nr:MmgE/PrpD family protein [Pseudonocardia sp.]